MTGDTLTPIINADAYRARIQRRLSNRLRSVSDRAIAERIAQEKRDRHEALIRRAREWGITLEPDPGHPGQYISRFGKGAPNPGPRHHHINLTTRISCTCVEFATWHRCPCQALVIELERSRIVTIAELHHGTEAA